MSSTARGGVREESDYYVTPVAEIEKFLLAWSEDSENGGPKEVRRILDPCAGGRIGGEGMSYPIAIRARTELFPKLENIRTLDIRTDSQAEEKGYDYRTAVVAPVDLIITNPPFCHAVEIVEKALADVRPLMNWGGYVVMLQRLNFLGGDLRLDFWQKCMPYRIYVHSKRMGFKRHMMGLPKAERNKTDSIEYAHFVWWTGWKESHTPFLRVI